ncbi:MAG: putative recombinase, partial [Myxococcales bacterium]|nr:putative recombinase [Myxococcales bacterium]
MRAVCYPRVSSSQQRDRDTIESQRRVLPEFISRQGWQMVKPIETYVDDGRTAKAGHLDKRTGLAGLLRDAALGLFDVVVVMDIDRLTRSEDLAERGAILGALQHANVKLAAAMSGQVLDLSTSSGDLFSSLHAFFAAEWTRKHRTRVSEGRITAVKRGHAPAGRRPFWLRYDKNTKTLSLDPSRGELVRELFERVAAGESCRGVADDFHQRGAPKPRGEWNRSVAQRMIRSKTPLGEWTVDQKRALVLQVPRLVDDDLWRRAQDSMNANAHRGLRKTKHEYLLEGVGVCGRCGAPMGIRSAVWDA